MERLKDIFRGIAQAFLFLVEVVLLLPLDILAIIITSNKPLERLFNRFWDWLVDIHRDMQKRKR